MQDVLNLGKEMREGEGEREREMKLDFFLNRFCAPIFETFLKPLEEGNAPRIFRLFGNVTRFAKSLPF